MSFIQALETEKSGRHAQLESNIRVGEDLIAEEHFGAPKIQDRITNVQNMWQRLQELSDQRKARLLEAVDLYQVHLSSLSSPLLPLYSQTMIIHLNML